MTVADETAFFKIYRRDFSRNRRNQENSGAANAAPAVPAVPTYLCVAPVFLKVLSCLLLHDTKGLAGLLRNWSICLEMCFSSF